MARFGSRVTGKYNDIPRPFFSRSFSEVQDSPMLRSILSTATALLLTTAGVAQPPASLPKANDLAPIEQVLIHPLFAADFGCSEHWEGQLPYPGDALGKDCFVYGGKIDGDDGFLRTFKTDGSTNEDWYGWGEKVLAPFDSMVAKINVNPVVNKPGRMGRGPATFVIFKHTDGTMVMVGHLTDITVKEGDKVIAGQPFAKVGNNGFSRAPHIHVGAWRDKTPLQIRFDLRAMGKLRSSNP